MYELDITLKPPTSIWLELFEDMWQGFTSFLIILIWIVFTTLNLLTLGVFGFIWKFLLLHKYRAEIKYKGYSISVYGKKLYENVK